MTELVKDWTDKLMVHDWPENGPGAVAIEALYQSFKARLVQELQVDVPHETHYGRLIDTEPR